MRELREQVEQAREAEAAGQPPPAWFAQIGANPVYFHGTVPISGHGFEPGEPVRVSLDGDEWHETADNGGNFTTSRSYGPQLSPPRQVTATGGWSGAHAEAWLS